MDHPTAEEISEALTEHVRENTDFGGFAEDRFPGHRLTYVPDTSGGDMVLMEENYDEDTGRRFRVRVQMLVERLPDEVPAPQ